MILNYDDVPQKSLYYIGGYIIALIKNGDRYNIKQLFDLYKKNNKRDNISLNLFLYSIDWLMMIGVILSTDIYVKNVFTETKGS